MAKTGLKIIGLKATQRKMSLLKNLVRKGDKKLFEDIGKDAVALIRKKTKSGKDFEYNKFQKYSPEYAKKKGQKSVDLEVSEDMMKAIRYQALGKKVRIYVKKLKHSKFLLLQKQPQ